MKTERTELLKAIMTANLKTGTVVKMLEALTEDKR